MTIAAVGPAWVSGGDGRYSGRFPLAVERHAMAMVGHLLPGITTVTAHARYYTLHTAVFSVARRDGLDLAETRRLLRRAEVVLGAVSMVHGTTCPDEHEGMRSPHGSDHIAPRLSAGADIDALSADRAYAQAGWGFWGPYVASEFAMGLLATEGERTVEGPNADSAALRTGFEGLFELTARSSLTVGELAEASHLCMCQAKSSTDGEMLRRILLPQVPESMHDEDRRAQTLRMLLRLTELAETTGVEDLENLLLFGEGRHDGALRSLEVVPAWTGVVLRTITVAGWRELWRLLVLSIDGLMSIGSLGKSFAEGLPGGSVGEFVASRPAGLDATGLQPAEFSEQVEALGPLERALSRLVIGASRSGRLDERVQAYFQGHGAEQFQQLTPIWLQDRLAEWADRPLRDFANWLTHELIARAERIAMMKATFDYNSGEFRVPTRVYVRDGFVFKDSEEAGGGVALRWDSAMQIMGGIGLVSRDSERWVVTDAGRNA